MIQYDTKNILYYYCSLETALEFILPKLELRLSPISDTNDPRENKDFIFSTISKRFKELRGISEEKINFLLRENCKLLCFSIDENNFYPDKENPHFGYGLSRMWAYYSDNHKGVCLHIDKNKFIKENNKFINPDYFKKINYIEIIIDNYDQKLKIELDEMKTKGAEKYIKDFFRIKNLHFLYFTKFKEWETEYEERLIFFSKEKSQDEYCSIKNSLKEITFGVDFCKSYLPSFKKLCPKIKFSNMFYNGVRFVKREIS